MKETDEQIQAARSQPSTNFQGLTQEGDNVSLLEMTLGSSSVYHEESLCLRSCVE